MSETRARLDRKLALLEAQARELTPGRLKQRYMPPYVADRALGALLTLIGIKLAWRTVRANRLRRTRVRAALQSYGRY
jgi:hypothetical protein